MWFGFQNSPNNLARVILEVSLHSSHPWRVVLNIVPRPTATSATETARVLLLLSIPILLIDRLSVVIVSIPWNERRRGAVYNKSNIGIISTQRRNNGVHRTSQTRRRN